jgi:hypothetical protein
MALLGEHRQLDSSAILTKMAHHMADRGASVDEAKAAMAQQLRAQARQYRPKPAPKRRAPRQPSADELARRAEDEERRRRGARYYYLTSSLGRIADLAAFTPTAAQRAAGLEEQTPVHTATDLIAAVDKKDRAGIVRLLEQAALALTQLTAACQAQGWTIALPACPTEEAADVTSIVP